MCNLRERVEEELLRDVVATVAVLEGKVELVAIAQHLEASGRPRTFETSAAPAEHVDGDVAAELMPVRHATVGSGAVAHEPRHHLRPPGGVVDLRRTVRSVRVRGRRRRRSGTARRDKFVVRQRYR